MAGKSQLPLGGSSHTRRTGSVARSPDTRGTGSGVGHVCPLTGSSLSGDILDPGGQHLALGLMSLVGTTCGGLGSSRVWHGRVTCPPGARQVTPTEPEEGAGSRDCDEPDVRAGHVTPADPEVARLVPSCLPAGAILARGLMSLMGTTCIDLGISRVWWGRVICPLAAVK